MFKKKCDTTFLKIFLGINTNHFENIIYKYNQLSVKKLKTCKNVAWLVETV